MSRYQFPAQATTDASLLVSGTLADARLSSNVALENVANVFTAKQSFSGTTHVGLCLHSLTTSEYNALTPANGDLFRDSTTDRIDARLVRGTVELIDTAGGQTINGAFNVTGVVQIGASGPRIVPNIGGSGRFQVTRGDGTGDFYVGEGGTGGTTVRYLGAVTSGAPGTSAPTCYLSPQSAGVWQMGTTTNNALGSLNLTNLTASGTVRLGTFTVGTLPSAAANTRAMAFVTDSNLAFNSTNLGSTVTAGGAILVPVFSDGINWVIG